MNHEFLWIGFGIVVFMVMLMDLGVFHKKGKTMTIREAAIKTLIFVALALGFNAAVWMRAGPVAGMEFLAGYFIELSLSVDNLFVFLMLFTYFKVPNAYQNRVLFWGIFGAFILRAIFIFAGLALINEFHWIMYIFGAFLVFTAVKMLFQKEEAPDIEGSFLIKNLKKIFPVTSDFHSDRFFVKQNGRLLVTPLLIILVLVEATDLIFAFDSIPAIFSITKDPFIVFTSNVFAILGLRALYFCISGLMDRFIYLKPALSFILAFVGIKMLIANYFVIPIAISLLFIFGALLVAICASALKTKYPKK